MICPSCASDTPAPGGRCTVCSAEVSADVAAAVATPVPTDPPAAGNDASGAGTFAAQLGYVGQASEEDLTQSADASEFPLSTGSGPLVPGQAFGPRYQVIKLLGAGGMGEVYHAWDQELAVAVALKVIRPEATAEPEAAADLHRRFKRELLLARQVTHKNVVRIHDMGEVGGVKYITMPYIPGDDLAAILRREGKLTVPRALGIARQVAAGLAAAHEAGVVHRDLKPPNIMIDPDGNAVIMDFGIARSVDTGGSTVAGMVVGTLSYMAPEQARGEEVDQRADIYAFGLILTDMLVGRRQTGAKSSALAELMERMQHAPPPIRSVDPTIPEAVERDRLPLPGARSSESVSNDGRADRGSRRSRCRWPSDSPALAGGIETPAPPYRPAQGPGPPGAIPEVDRHRSGGRRRRGRRHRAAPTAHRPAGTSAGRRGPDDLARHPAVSQRLGRLLDRLAGTQPGGDAFDRRRAVGIPLDRPVAKAPSDSARPEDLSRLDLRSLHDAQARPVQQRGHGPVGTVLEVRRRDPDRRHARRRQTAAVRGAQGAGPEPERPSGRRRSPRAVGSREPLSLRQRPRRAQGHRVQAFHSVARGLEGLQRRAAARALGQAVRGAQEVPGVDPGRSGVRVRVREARPDLCEPGLRHGGRAELASGHGAFRATAGTGEIPHRREPRADRQRHGQGDRGLREPGQGVAGRSRGQLRAGLPLRVLRRFRQGAQPTTRRSSSAIRSTWPLFGHRAAWRSRPETRRDRSTP